MSQAHTVDELGRYDGLTLAQAVPHVIDEIVTAVDLFEIILFGSVARGDDGPDSGIDLLVVFDMVEASDKRSLMRTTRAAVKTFVPLDIVVADLAEIATERSNVGSAVYWPLREGVSVYRRPVADAN
ncbi:MAG: nucleotidyltransferase domain-containing protein [Acidimicrobiales bacterium]